MKKNKFYGIGFVLIGLMVGLNSSSPCFALAQFGDTTTTEIKGVKLADSLKIDDAKAPVSLKRVTQGLRQKKVVLIWASVYVAQIFSNAPAEFVSVETLKASLLKGIPIAVSMTFVRDVGIEKIVDGFKDVLKENKIDETKAPLSDFVAAVKSSGDVKDQQSYYFVFQAKEGKESVSFQTKGKEWFTVVDGAPGTHEKFLNLWLGKPVDSGLEKLQEQLLKH